MYKKKGLVANIATGSFLLDITNINLDAITGNTLFLVPPKIDFPNKITVTQALWLDKSKLRILIKFDTNMLKNDINEESFEKILVDKKTYFKFLNLDSSKVDPINPIGKILKDKNFGEIGKVVDIEKGNLQQRLIVKGKKSTFAIPFVSEFIYDYDDTCLYSKIPEGLTKLGDYGY